MAASASPIDPQDLFLFVGPDDDFEDLSRYRKHGLHPVLLGDKLPKPSTCVSDAEKKPRYRILYKLGKGGFATVWLARDDLEKRYVAVKISQGTDSPLLSNEANILSHLAKTASGKPGFEFIIQLFDAFVIEGPNGFHECLVTEVVAPFNDCDARSDFPSDGVRQIVQGFALLHQEGIVHGGELNNCTFHYHLQAIDSTTDPHLGNFGIAVPQLDSFDEEDLFNHFSHSEIVPVIPCQPEAFPPNSLPAYIARRESIPFFLRQQNRFPSDGDKIVKIFDFGRAYRLSDSIPDLPGAVPLASRPPELVFSELYSGKHATSWSEAADIWAVGCVLYRMMLGHEAFSAWGSLDARLSNAIRYGGPPPEDWPIVWSGDGDDKESVAPNERDKEAPPSYKHVTIPIQQDQNRFDPRNLKRKGVSPFLDLVDQMIVTKPDKRSPFKVLASHPFVAQSCQAT